MRPLQINEKIKLKTPKIKESAAKNAIYIKTMSNYSQPNFGGIWVRLWKFVKENKLYSAGIEHPAIYHDDPKVTESNKLRTDICFVIVKPVEAEAK